MSVSGKKEREKIGSLAIRGKSIVKIRSRSLDDLRRF
jgi:hypothetical protein